MSELCSEVENMNTSREYFSFIKDMFNDYAKYIKQYRMISADYMKKLDQLQDKYSPQLCDLNKNKKKYKSITTKFIFSITSKIPKIIKQQIDNIVYSINGIDTTIKNIENIIKEKTNIAIKYQEKYDDAKNNLLKNYRNIDKLKDLYMTSMSNCEDIIYKYYNNNRISTKTNSSEDKNKKDKKDKKDKEKKDKKDKNKNLLDSIFVTKDQFNNAILNSKKLEKQYKNSFESTEKYEKSFNELAEECTENVKKLSCELTIKLKDIIIDFIVLLKNSFKMPLSEIDTILPEITKLDYSNYEKIIVESYNLNKKLIHAKPKKYKMKCFNQPLTINGKYNPNNHIAIVEDGFEELTFIDDSPTFLTVKEMTENFELLDNDDIDLKLEEEKVRTRDLTEKLLSFGSICSNCDDSIPLSEEEIQELMNLLDKHHNRVLFLQCVSTFRAKGRYDLPLHIYDLIYKLFVIIIDLVERDKDYHCGKNVIILSQTYFLEESNKNGKKRYLQEEIKKDKLFTNYNFWKEYLEFSIEKEIVRSVKSDTKNGTLIKENQKESDDMYTNIVFAQLVPIADNMIEFGLDRKKIKEIIKPIIKHYNMNEQSITIIDDVIHKNSERKSILLNEEIKQIDTNELYLNYKNFDSNKKFNNLDENMCDKIEDENNDIENFNLYENDDENENENKINEGEENKDKDKKDENKNEEKESAQSEYLYKQ